MPIRRRDGESIAAGADNSPFNWELTCGHCNTYLGPLGRFFLRTSNGARGLPPQGDSFRAAHCPICHHNAIIRGDAHERWYPPLMRGSLCLVASCPNPHGIKSAADLEHEIRRAVEDARRDALKN